MRSMPQPGVSRRMPAPHLLPGRPRKLVAVSPRMVRVTTLTPHQQEVTARWIGELLKDDPQAQRWARSAAELAHVVPRPVRQALAPLVERTGPPAVLVRGLPLPARLPPTPDRCGRGTAPEMLDGWMRVLASRLGNPFSWDAHDRLIKDVLPAAGPKAGQPDLTRAPLLPRVEDAWHPGRCDHLLLGCVRNIERAVTTVAAAADLGVLMPNVLGVLAQRRYSITSAPGVRPQDPYEAEPVAALVLSETGRPEQLRVDLSRMRALPGDREAARALALMGVRMRETAMPIVLEPGDVLVLDNARCAHGRGPIPAAVTRPRRRWIRRVMTSLCPVPRHLPQEFADQGGPGRTHQVVWSR